MASLIVSLAFCTTRFLTITVDSVNVSEKTLTCKTAKYQIVSVKWDDDTKAWKDGKQSTASKVIAGDSGSIVFDTETKRLVSCRLNSKASIDAKRKAEKDREAKEAEEESEQAEKEMARRRKDAEAKEKAEDARRKENLEKATKVAEYIDRFTKVRTIKPEKPFLLQYSRDSYLHCYGKINISDDGDSNYMFIVYYEGPQWFLLKNRRVDFLVNDKPLPTSDNVVHDGEVTKDGSIQEAIAAPLTERAFRSLGLANTVEVRIAGSKEYYLSDAQIKALRNVYLVSKGLQEASP